MTIPKESQESMDLDEILDELGLFGRFQSITFLLISFPIIFSAIFALSYVFTAGDLNYRCRIPECDFNETSFRPQWLKNAVPFTSREGSETPSRCLRYRYLRDTIDDMYEDANTSNTYMNAICGSNLFNRSDIFRCNEWVYEDEGTTILREVSTSILIKLQNLLILESYYSTFYNLSLTKLYIDASKSEQNAVACGNISHNCVQWEWDITCEDNRWALTIVGTINNIGQFIGMPIAGLLSDRIGRKRTLVLAVLLAGIMGLARSMAWSYTSFLLFEFLDPLCGSGLYTAGFVLGMESVGPKGRVYAGTIISVFYTIGEVILGGVAMWLQNWRLATESVRWLLTKGRSKEACQIILKAAKTNKVVLPQHQLNKIKFSSAVKEKNFIMDFPSSLYRLIIDWTVESGLLVYNYLCVLRAVTELRVCGWQQVFQLHITT
ncbi:hypothetical protein C0J52_20014 [Blattella germanica]|nr:hypothetical protein C0J52_20014 [Blattella germanica]